MYASLLSLVMLVVSASSQSQTVNSYDQTDVISCGGNPVADLQVIAVFVTYIRLSRMNVSSNQAEFRIISVNASPPRDSETFETSRIDPKLNGFKLIRLLNEVSIQEGSNSSRIER